jgi:hypothetical protein
MKYEVEIDLPVEVGAVLPYIEDLMKYPLWMGLVHAVGPADDGGGHQVELRGKIGPFARSKRLRMIRVEQPDPLHIRFERHETDGRSHGQWVLEANLSSGIMSSGMTSPQSGTRLFITLNYEGSLWSSVVERVLADEVERSKSRLRDLLLSN